MKLVYFFRGPQNGGFGRTRTTKDMVEDMAIVKISLDVCKHMVEDMLEDMEIVDISLDVCTKNDSTTLLIWLRSCLRTWELLVFC